MSFPQENIDHIRAEQIAEARRLSDAERDGTATRTRPVLRLAPNVRPGHVGTSNREPARKNVLKGHEAFLKALEMNGAKVEVEKCDGTIYRGVLKHTDKYTITLHATDRGHVDNADQFVAIEQPRDRVIFKHDMSEFSALTPRQAPAATEGNE